MAQSGKGSIEKRLLPERTRGEQDDNSVKHESTQRITSTGPEARFKWAMTQIDRGMVYGIKDQGTWRGLSDLRLGETKRQLR